MTLHSDSLHQMCRKHFNEPVLVLDKIGRCIGYGETGVDCYILIQHCGGKVVWWTCVGGYIFLDRLKGQDAVFDECGNLKWDDFTRVDSHLELNGAPKMEEFRLDLQHDDMEYRNLTDVLEEQLEPTRP